MKKFISFCTIVLFISTALIAQDIRSNTAGISVAAGLAFSGWSSDSEFISVLSDEEPNGAGYFVGLGYGFNQHISLHYYYCKTNFIKNFDYTTFRSNQNDLKFRYTFGATLSKFRGFVNGGISISSKTVDPVTFDGFNMHQLKMSGLGFIVGGGCDFFITDRISLGGDIEYKFGSFGQIEIDHKTVDVVETVDFSYLNFSLNLKYLLWTN